MGKICNRCKIENGTDNCGFVKDKSRKDGLSIYCKRCNYERNKKWRQENPEKVKETNKRWEQENPEKVKEKHKKWKNKNINYFTQYYKENREKINETNRKWASENREKINETNRKWALKNKERIKENQKKWYQENKEKGRENQNRRRAKILGNGYEKYNLKDIYERDNWICQICNQPVDKDLQYPDPQSKSIDHIIPIVKGGPDTFENVQLAHLICNISKGSKI